MSALHRRDADVVRLLETILGRNGCSPHVASILAENCVRAQRDGSTSHGVFRVKDYVSTLRSGWVDGAAEPVVEDAAPGVVRVDGRNGFAPVALAQARGPAVRKAREQGIVLVAIRNSHHLGALGLDVEPFAAEGLVALSVVNSMAVVAAPGTARPVYGTNPLAFAAPQADGPPLVIDLAASAMAHGDVRVHAAEGRPVPVGTGVDPEGRPTTDAAAILDGGALLPFGGHKGTALALMVEVLCAALVGGQFSHEVDWSTHPGARSPRTGQTLILIDPTAGAERLPVFADRVGHMVRTARGTGQAHLPGDRRLAHRAASPGGGVTLSEAEWAELETLTS